ncbi:Gfo/Idh/MocA family oxidoreductase [Phanerochaete sordida]|uniref:Gfo/Idh/MocA family oxidoreductase n=1 Tax=Phanerochaete sordida TaxID=48140 RepID=A0A9P3G8K6_9APHY|nr:Gfo/Idh/MocA family oxidoreductase [Phanerochaete sordida]
MSTPSAPTSRRGSIDPSQLVPMHKVPHSSGSGDFNVVFVGAGNIMFGSDEGPWNHSFRFEHKLGPRFKLIALIDPWLENAEKRLNAKRETFVRSAYEDTKVYKNFEEFVQNKTPNMVPNAFVIGSPPMFRGTKQAGKDVELQILKHFPGVPLFVEKPVATGPKEELTQVIEVGKAITQSNTICSVGYMLRYLRATQMMKKIIEDNNLTIMSTIARYASSYESIAKPDWWNKAKSAGPIIEQATHFCDLSRYFGGEVDISSVVAHSVEWDDAPGKLSKVRVDESAVPPEDRISRATSAVWKYENGAIGSLTHLIALQGHDYSCELEVYADGYQLKLVNPYVEPVLYVRRPGSDAEEKHNFADDDPFFSEVSVFVDNIEDIEESPETAEILSSFEDAVRTYELTWAITEAAEKTRAARKAKAQA